MCWWSKLIMTAMVVPLVGTVLMVPKSHRAGCNKHGHALWASEIKKSTHGSTFANSGKRALRPLLSDFEP